MSEEEANNLLNGKHLQGWKQMGESTSNYMLANNVSSWLSLHEPDPGPNHWGWSRLVSENFKAKNITAAEPGYALSYAYHNKMICATNRALPSSLLWRSPWGAGTRSLLSS